MTRITRNFVTILLLMCFVNSIIGRPQLLDENEGEAEEAYYNNDDSVASDTLRDEQDSRMRNDELQAAQFTNRHHRYKENEQHNMRDEDPNLAWDNFSEMKRENSVSINSAVQDSEALMNSEDRTLAKRRANNYIESSETNEQSSSDMHDKRNLDGQTKGQDLSDLIIFDNTRDQLNKMEKNMYKDGGPTHEDPRYNQQYNQPYMDRNNNKDKQYPTRERRQSQETTEKDASVSNAAKDNEASLIKQQIQELSSQELEELLNSLSGDKRSLLKKILEDNATDNLNKREITKKAGTVEESNCVETSQIVLSDKQGGSLITESPRTESSEVSKDTSADNPSSKVADIANDTKVELSNDDAQLTPNKVNLSTDLVNNVEANQQDSKIESKRETNDDEVSFEGNEEQCSDIYSAAMSDDSNLQEENHNSFKREAPGEDSDVADAMKSLEESFPNPKSYEDNSYDANMAPLVRVKRKDFVTVKKRSANLIQNGNVAYIPYNAENEDDNEEAGDFEDEGFNDQVPTNDKNYGNDKPSDDSLHNAESRPQEIKSDKDPQYCPRREQSPAANGDRENEAIGSDTDSVISGVEGADENLMYSSGSRSKRNLEHIYKPDGDLNRVYRTTPVVENEIQSDSENINVGNYQENDAFGPLPRNYEGDLGRYKRVRHVKQK